MNKEELRQFLIQEPTRVKVGNYYPLLSDMMELTKSGFRSVTPFKDEGIKNTLTYDKTTGNFILEMFEFENSNGENMYSVFDSFEHIETALKYCRILNTDNQNLITQKWLDERA